MHLISFDIGIKNLAYCVFSLFDNQLRIVKWGTANLMPSEQQTQTTNCSKCAKKACVTHADVPFCKIHAKKTGGIDADSVPKYRSYKKDDLVKLLQTNNIQFNMADLKPELLKAADAYYAKNVLHPIKTKPKTTANQIHLVTIGTNIKTQMDAVLTGLPHMDIVILENQISPIAGRMNTIQGMLAQYFVMHGTPRIEFIASAGKLKDFKQISGTEYKNHKEDGIQFCRMFLRANIADFANKETEILDVAIKKDDLADCFLQGVYFLKREKIISYSENLEIKLVG